MVARIFLYALWLNILLFGAASAAYSCSESLTYRLSISGLEVGALTKLEQRDGEQLSIASHSKASILGIGTEYHQQATALHYANNWYTQRFSQLVSGFKNRELHSWFSQDGLHSKVELNGEQYQYQSDSPLRDIDTIILQIKALLTRGEQQFRLTRQASDGLEPYQFEVVAQERLELTPLGSIETLKVSQTGQERITYWFAPSMQMQLVRAQYHGWLFDGYSELVEAKQSCDPKQTAKWLDLVAMD